MTDVWGFDYMRVRSNSDVKYDNFNGDIEFVVNNNESERYINPKNSYLSLRLRIVQTDETGVAGNLAPIVNKGATKAAATLMSIPYINPNPAASLFTGVSFNLGEEMISKPKHCPVQYGL